MNKILIVDDEKHSILILERLLKMHGFDVAKALGGEEAIKIFSADTTISLMVIDIKMSGINGLEVLHKKKALEKKFPVLIHTASVDIKNRLGELKKLGIGAEDILIKPVDFNVIVEKIRRKLKPEKEG